MAPAASAKFKLWLTVSDATPTVRQPITVRLRSGIELDHDLKLIAVAPGRTIYNVVGVVTGDSRHARARIPRDGFEIPVVRVTSNRWRARASFPRPGRWRLVIPNFAPVGFMIPPPLTRTIVVGSPAG